MKVIAHRGSHKAYRENSLAAFSEAIRVGVDSIELDVHITKDGKVVVHHDESVCAQSFEPDHGPERNCSLKDTHSDVLKRWRYRNTEALDAGLAFLEDALELCFVRGNLTEMNIEIKGSDPAVCAPVLGLIQSFGLEDRVLISSFYPQPLTWFLRQCPGIRRAFLTDNKDLDGSIEPMQRARQALELIDSNILHPMAHDWTLSAADQAKRHGWVVNVWYPMLGEESQRESSWSYLVEECNVDGICTNYPKEFIAWKRRRSLS